MTTYAYMRVSTDKQDTASQAAWLAQFGIESSNTYQDEAKSGKSFKGRVAWLELASRIKRGDVLYCYSLDRVSRDLIDQLTVLRDFVERKGITIITVEGQQSYGLTEKVKAMVAEEERRKIGERTRAGMIAAKAAGKQIGRPANTELHERVKALKASGLSVSAIAREASITRATVYAILKSCLII